MRRYIALYNGKRYVLNTYTGEIHDLDSEIPSCHINEIKAEHIYMADTYDEAQIHAVIAEHIANPNGCHYCIPSKDNG